MFFRTLIREEPHSMPAGLTLRWATQDGATHTLLTNGALACDPQIIARWPFETCWKSDLPPDAVPCRACEAILAGEAP